jgi:Aminopeptidase P, N-terminal domain
MSSRASHTREDQCSRFFGLNKLTSRPLLLSALFIVTWSAFGQDTKHTPGASAPAVAMAERTPGNSGGTAFTHMGINASEFQARRQSVANAVPDGIILLHSFSAPKSWSDSGFRQDSNFYYLTGLENLHDAILAIDGTQKESWLFVKPPTEREQRRFAVLTAWDSVYLIPDHQTEQVFSIDHIVGWEEFSNFIETRRKANPKIPLPGLDWRGQDGCGRKQSAGSRAN